MKRFRLLGLAVVAMLLVAAATAGTASAEEGGNPSILPNTTGLTFTSETDTGTEPVLETSVNKLKVKCTKATNEGAFSTGRLGTVTVIFVGCKEGKANCLTGKVSGEIKLEKADFHVVDVLLPGEVLALGLWIEPLEAGKNLFKFKCGVIQDEVRGSVIGEADNVAELEKTKHLTILFDQKAGVQAIKTCNLTKEFCAGKTFQLESNLGKGFESAGQEADVLILFNKEVEFHF